MKTVIFGAGSDLGVHIDGTSLGPKQLINDISSFYKDEIITLEQDKNIIKSKNLSDRRKNEYEIERFNEALYDAYLKKINNEECFPILIGGDHTTAIPSALANVEKHKEIGIIWIDAHADFNTFQTTETGNLHGLPLATIVGYENNELRYYHKGNLINPSKCVIVGARSIDNAEKDNLRYANVKVYTTNDIKEKGVNQVLDEAFEIAGKKTAGIHVSFDLDVITPEVAPGVSVPEDDGITEEETMKITKYLSKNIKDITSFDLVEFNPLRDENRKTEQIAVNVLAEIIKAASSKTKFDNERAKE